MFVKYRKILSPMLIHYFLILPSPLVHIFFNNITESRHNCSVLISTVEVAGAKLLSCYLTTVSQNEDYSINHVLHEMDIGFS